MNINDYLEMIFGDVGFVRADWYILHHIGKGDILPTIANTHVVNALNNMHTCTHATRLEPSRVLVA